MRTIRASDKSQKVRLPTALVGYIFQFLPTWQLLQMVRQFSPWPKLAHEMMQQEMQKRVADYFGADKARAPDSGVCLWHDRFDELLKKRGESRSWARQFPAALYCSIMDRDYDALRVADPISFDSLTAQSLNLRFGILERASLLYAAVGHPENPDPKVLELLFCLVRSHSSTNESGRQIAAVLLRQLELSESALVAIQAQSTEDIRQRCIHLIFASKVPILDTWLDMLETLNEWRFGRLPFLKTCIASHSPGLPALLGRMTLAEVEPPASSIKYLLHRAAEFNNVSAIELLLAKGVRLFTYNNKGQTPFYVACKMGSLASAQALLNAAAASSSKYRAHLLEAPIAQLRGHSYTERGYTPLCVALYEGRDHVALWLIQEGANLRPPGIGNILYLVCDRGQLAVFKAILDIDPSLLLQKNPLIGLVYEPSTPFHNLACISKTKIITYITAAFPRMVPALLEDQCSGKTALCWAISRCNRELTLHLLELKQALLLVPNEIDYVKKYCIENDVPFFWLVAISLGIEEATTYLKTINPKDRLSTLKKITNVVFHGASDVVKNAAEKLCLHIKENPDLVINIRFSCLFRKRDMDKDEIRRLLAIVQNSPGHAPALPVLQ